MGDARVLGARMDVVGKARGLELMATGRLFEFEEAQEND